jgi:hypothetical protein
MAAAGKACAATTGHSAVSGGGQGWTGSPDASVAIQSR